MSSPIATQLTEAVQTLRSCQTLLPRLEEAAACLRRALQRGGVIAFCGNGGSASQAQHLAAELVGRFRRERRPLRALALTCDGALLTALSNDYGDEQIFARQVEGLLRRGDVLVVLSTSGNSANVCRAAQTARSVGVTVVAFTGRDGGQLASLCDLELRVPAQETARIQEAHLLLGHLLCDLLEAGVANSRGRGEEVIS
jgi:D-sedoheptulose 7-phosphate isomerase